MSIVWLENKTRQRRIAAVRRRIIPFVLLVLIVAAVESILLDLPLPVSGILIASSALAIAGLIVLSNVSAFRSPIAIGISAEYLVFRYRKKDLSIPWKEIEMVAHYAPWEIELKDGTVVTLYHVDQEIRDKVMDRYRTYKEMRIQEFS